MKTLSRVLCLAMVVSWSCTVFADPLSGTVRYSDGTPVGGAVVYALSARRPLTVRNNTVMVGEAVPRALSGSDGAFQIEVDPANQLASSALERMTGESSPPPLAWPFGMWCNRRDSHPSNPLPAAVTLLGLFLPAVAIKVRRK